MKRPIKKAQYGCSRRQFINMLGAGATLGILTDPLHILTRGLTDGLIAKAQAQESNVAPRNYVVALHYGAPPRWVFDNFLRPQGANSAFIKNLSCNNYIPNDQFLNAARSDLEYRDAEINLSALGGTGTVHLPIMWGGTIPTSTGTFVPTSSILNNTLLIRGVHMEVDIGHSSGPSLVTRVSAGAPSLTGLVADASSKRIAAVGLTPAVRLGGYKSAKGTSIAYIEPPWTGNVDDAVSRILEPFIHTDPTVINSGGDRLKMDSYIEASMRELSAYASSSKFGADTLYKDRNNAEELLKTNLQSAISEYNSALVRYKNLAIECASYLPGIIPEGKGLPMHTTNNVSISGAQGFAAAEVLIKRGFSSTVTFGMGSGGSWGLLGISNYNDEHSGQYENTQFRDKSLVVHSHQFRCVAAWLNEFRAALGPALFNETVVHVSAEYGRNPSNDPANLGSDHAPGATSMTLFSGAIKNPIFIGNISVGASTGTYMGTWGTAATTQTQAGNIIITKKNVGASVADILRVQRPTNDQPVFTEQNGKVVSLAEAPKNV
jgi:Protein of unknown function (DUF1501)